MSNVEDILVDVAIVKVDGNELSDAAWDDLMSVDVELSAGAVGWCRLVLRVEGGPPAQVFNIGSKLDVAFDDGSTTTDLFSGDIVALNTDVDLSGQVLVVEAFDASYRLGADVKVRTFVKQSDNGILQTIAGECGLTLTGESSGGFSTVAEHRFQNCTNQQFVEQICRRHGAEWRVADGKLVIGFKTTKPTVELAYGDGLSRLSARYSAADVPKDVTVRGWDPTKKQAISAKVTASADRTTSGLDKSADKLANPRSVTSIRSLVVSDTEAKNIATGIAQQMVSTAFSGSGEAYGNPKIAPGAVVKIQQMTDERWNGDYYVTAARHVYDAGLYRTEFEFGPVEPLSIVDSLDGTNSSTSGGRGISRGVTIGIVTNNDDDAHPASVKLRFPYLSDDLESDWARVTSLGAGPDRGIIFMPEIDDEVLVAFEHGDLRRPYVLGGLWNGKDKPPAGTLVDDGDVVERVIAATAGGDGKNKAHLIRMRNGSNADERFVAIELGDGKTKAHIGESKIEVIANNGKTIELKNDKGSILIDAQGNVTIKGEKVTIESKSGDLTVKSAMNLKLEGSMAANVKAGTTAEVKSSASMTVDGGGMLNLKGGMVKVN